MYLLYADAASIVYAVTELKAVVGFSLTTAVDPALNFIFGFIIIIMPQLLVIFVKGVVAIVVTYSKAAFNSNTKD